MKSSKKRMSNIGLYAMMSLLLLLTIRLVAKSNSSKEEEEEFVPAEEAEEKVEEDMVIVSKKPDLNKKKKVESALLPTMDPYWEEGKSWHQKREYTFYRQTINATFIEEIKAKTDQSRKTYDLCGVEFIKCRFEMDIKDFVYELAAIDHVLYKGSIRLHFVGFDGYFDDEDMDAPVFPFDNFMDFLSWTTNEMVNRILLQRTKISKDQFLQILEKIDKNTDLREGWDRDERKDTVTLAMGYDEGYYIPLDDEDVQRKMWYMSQMQPWRFDHEYSNTKRYWRMCKVKEESPYPWVFNSKEHMNRFFSGNYFRPAGEPVAVRTSRFDFQIYANYFEFFGFLDSGMNFDRGTVHPFEIFQARINKFFTENCNGQEKYHTTSYTDGEGDDVVLRFKKRHTRLDDGSSPK